MQLPSSQGVKNVLLFSECILLEVPLYIKNTHADPTEAWHSPYNNLLVLGRYNYSSCSVRHEYTLQ